MAQARSRLLGCLPIDHPAMAASAQIMALQWWLGMPRCLLAPRLVRPHVAPMYDLVSSKSICGYLHWRPRCSFMLDMAMATSASHGSGVKQL